jgi:response regulator of citrate/malate metabolism
MPRDRARGAHHGRDKRHTPIPHGLRPQSRERCLAILDSFSAKRPKLGIADLADELSVHRSTAHRYVMTLLALGYLEQDSSRKYRLTSCMPTSGLLAHDPPY